MSVIFSYMAYLIGLNYCNVYGFVWAIFASFSKASYEYYEDETFDIMNLSAMLAGAFLGSAIVLI